MAQAMGDGVFSTGLQAGNSVKEEGHHICEPRAETRTASSIGRVMDPTTLIIVEPDGVARFVLCCAGAASATSGDGLVPDQLDEED